MRSASRRSAALGAYGRVYEYGRAGLPTQVHNQDARGQILVEKSGLASQVRDYDTRGDLVGVEWRDVAGRPAVNQQNFVRVVLARSSVGNVDSEEYQDATRAVVSRGDRGFARLSQMYDAHGNLIEEAYRGLDGNPVLSKDRGAARMTWHHDERGNKVEHTYFGIDGKPVLLEDVGAARITWRYDERGNQVESAYFGIDDALVADADGIAVISTNYDDKRRVVTRAYLDVHREPVLIDDIGARAQYSYDDSDQVIGVIYRDTRDQIIPLTIVVQKITPNSTADRIGLAVGDRLLTYGGETLTSMQQLIALVSQPGTSARELAVRRGSANLSWRIPPGPLGVLLVNVRTETVPVAAKSLRSSGRR